MAEELVGWLTLILLGDQVILMVAMFCVCGLLERAFPATPVPRSHYKFNIRFSLLTAWLTGALAPWVSAGVARCLQTLGTGFIDLSPYGFGGVPGECVALLAAVIIQDFFLYWMHRSQHGSQIVWQEHVVHHSDEFMTVTTASRAHIFDLVIASVLVTIPMAVLFKLPPVTIGMLSLIPTAWQYVVHTNINLGFGPLWWLLASPNYHRIHHSLDPRHIDRNFASYFPIWDILFGTAVRPERGEIPSTGVAGVHLSTVTGALLHPLKGWARMMSRRPEQDASGAVSN